MSDDRTRAAELADIAERDGYIDICKTYEGDDLRLWIRAMHAYAAPPVAPEGLREAVTRAIYRSAYEGTAASRLARGACESVAQETAGAALAAIHAAGYVIAPREPTEAQRLAFEAQPGNWFDKMRATLAVGEVKR